MPEHQQEVEAGQQASRTVLVEVKSSAMPGKTTTKSSKARQHRKRRDRHNKFVAMQILAHTVSERNDKHIDTTPHGEETTKEPTADTIIPATDDETNPEADSEVVGSEAEETGRPQGSPLHVPDPLRVGETLAVSLHAEVQEHAEHVGETLAVSPHVPDIAIATIPIETDPAIPVFTPKVAEPPTIETFVPSTPPISEDVEDITPSLPVSRRTLFTCILLLVFLVDSLLLWRDLSAMHLLVSTINANNGTISSQQELASYTDNVRLTSPLSLQNASSSVLGVYTQSGSGTQQVLTLRNDAKGLSLQRSDTLANGSITQVSDGRLLVESADGLQVREDSGKLIWQMQGTQPTLGVHAFAPASDVQYVYTVASLMHSQIAAYDLNNGHVRWTVDLPDTIAYAPPLLLNGDTLYVASDAKLFALDTYNGNIRWEAPFAARTLLPVNSAQGTLLLALGPQGVQALQSTTGSVVWAFRGEQEGSTITTQFYQGTIASAPGTYDGTLYATGVTWQMSTVREDMRLYAIDTNTGTLRWLQQIATDSASVDAERLQQPYLDGTNSTVIMQRAIQNGATAITAYDQQNGRQRWNTVIPYAHLSAPTILQISPHTYAIFSTTASDTRLFHLESLYRAVLLLFMIASTCGLFVLLLASLVEGRIKIRRIAASTKRLVTYTAYYRKNWRTRYTRPVLVTLSVVIGIVLITFAVFEFQVQQQETLAADTQGRLVTINVGNKLHQLRALNWLGSEQWSLFSSEGTFSVPDVQAQDGMVLVALHGNTTHTYSVASDDPAYARPLNGMLALFLLNRDTGHIEWQQIVSYPGQQQQTSVVGLDSQYIYIVGEQIVNNTNSPNNIASTAQANAQPTRVLQLFAVSRTSGTVAWRVFGPEEPTSQQISFGTVRIERGLLLWHTGNTLFTIDTSLGQIIERSASGK